MRERGEEKRGIERMMRREMEGGRGRVGSDAREGISTLIHTITLYSTQISHINHSIFYTPITV